MATTAYEAMRQVENNFYVDGGDSARSILKMMEEYYNQYISQTQAFWNEARIDQRFVAGDQNLWHEIYSHIPMNRRKQFNFNRIRRIVNMISGHQRKHRKATVVAPIEGSDEETADQFTDIISWAYGRDNVYNTISDAFEAGSLVTGISLLNPWLDYSQDPASGDLRVNHLSYNSFMMDSYFRKMDLSDCSFIWTRKWLSKDEVNLLLPGREDEINSMSRNANKDQRFYYMPENYNFTIRDLLPYDEFWYQGTREAKILYDTKTGEVLEWKDDNKDKLQLFLNQYPEVKLKKVTRPTTYLAISVNNRIMFNGPNPLGIDKYPFVPVVGYWDPDNIYFQWRLQGLVRGLRDSQFLYNRRLITSLDILESQITSGMKVMEGSLVDNNDVLKTGQGQPIFIKSTAPLGMQSVEKIPSPGIDPSMAQLIEVLGNEMQQISGVNEELLGAAEDDKAGVLAMLRQGAGLTTLEKLFDQLDMSQKLLGELSIDIIQNNFTYGKVKRILNKEPTQQFFNKSFQKYDCKVAEGLLTDTQQKLEYLQYLHLKEVGIDVPSELLIDKAPIHGKKELKEAIMQKEQQAAQMAQQQAQLQMQGMEVDNKTKLAYSASQEALANERMAKIQLEQAVNAERISKAETEKTAAVLNIVKALHELDTMNLANIEQKLNLIRSLEGEQTNVQVKENSPQSQIAPQGGQAGI
jgi:hypothetical protein